MNRSHNRFLPLTALAAALTLLVPGLIVAQPGQPAPPGPPSDGPGFHRGGGDFGHRLGRLARVLELTDEQIAAARDLFEAHRADTEPLRQEQRAAHEQVRTLLEADPQDANAIGAQVIQAHAAGEQIRAAREQLMEDFRGLLTQEQQEKFDDFQEMRQNLRGERGRGGRRGPGRGGPGHDGPA